MKHLTMKITLIGVETFCGRKGKKTETAEQFKSEHGIRFDASFRMSGMTCAKCRERAESMTAGSLVEGAR